jgi:putative spermidine/putrescine transport system permease protein
MDKGRRPRSFYVLGAFFAVFVLFLYGPMSAIILLSFQGPSGGLTFPMNGVSTYGLRLYLRNNAWGISGGHSSAPWPWPHWSRC